MKIADIVSRKGPAFETIRYDASLTAAVDIMHRKSIGSLGITGNSVHEIRGMISQQELMAALVTHGSAALHQSVETIMRKPPLFCSCEDNAAEVMRMMTRDRCRHIIVLDGTRKIVGLISLGDLVAALLNEARLEAGVLRDLARSHLMDAAR